MEEKMFYDVYESPFCEIILVGNENGIRFLHLKGDKNKFVIDDNWVFDSSYFSDFRKQLDEYFLGERSVFDVKLNIVGTDFQRAVWNEMLKIPYGEVVSYKDLAVRIGNPKASRAIGMANNRNPIPLVIPCHRVIGSNGKMVGFALGVWMKEKLLELEGL